MTNEEKYIRDRVGRDNPFKVPEGYFDSLVSSVMDQLPELPAETVVAQQVPLFRRLRPLIYVAACLMIAVFSVMIFLDRNDSNTGKESLKMTVAQSATGSNDTYADEVADYLMVDNYDIYACLMNE